MGLLTIGLRAIKQVNTIFSKDENNVSKTINEILDAPKAQVIEHQAKVEKTLEAVEDVIRVAKKAKDVASAVKAKVEK